MALYTTAAAVAAALQLPPEGALQAAAVAGATQIAVNFASGAVPQNWAPGASLAVQYASATTREVAVVGGNITQAGQVFTVPLVAGLAYNQPQGSPVVEVSTFADVIESASRLIDRYCNLADNAFLQESTSETGYALVDRDGYVTIPARKAVVTAVSAVSYQVSPEYAATTIQDLTKVWADKYVVRVPPAAVITTSGVQPLSNIGNFRGRRIRYTMTYTGGYSPLPPEIGQAAVMIAARMSKSGAAGFSDVVGADPIGTLMYTRAMPREAQIILDRWARRIPWQTSAY